MSARRQRFQRGSGASRRPTTWARYTNTNISFAAANAYQTLDLLSNFKTDGGVQQGVTTMRTILRYTWLAPAPAEGDTFAVGIIRGQNTDLGASIAGAPDPINDPYEDWAYWAQHVADNNGLFFEHHANQLFIDLRSMRKLPELQMSYNVVLKVVSAPSFPATMSLTASTLLKLP